MMGAMEPAPQRSSLVDDTEVALRAWLATGTHRPGDRLRGAARRRASARARVAFTQMSAGPFHICGLDTSSTAFCWGWNREGELGDGTRIDRSAPVVVRAP